MTASNVLALEACARRQVRRAYYADGLFDLVYGLGIVGGAILALADRLSLFYMPLLWVITVLPAAKKRWVQPRTGYAAPAHPDRGRRWPLVLLTIVLAALVVLTGLAGQADRWPLVRAANVGIAWLMRYLGLLMGLLLGAALAWNGVELGIGRLVAYGPGFVAAGLLTLWPAALGGLAARLPAQGAAGAVGFGVMGVLMALAGAIGFARYLRRHPLPREEA